MSDFFYPMKLKKDGMAKYLFKATYSQEGMKGLLKEGGIARRDHVEELIEKLGGELEAFYFSDESADTFVIADLPDPIFVTAYKLKLSAMGAIQIKTVFLITPEEMEQATQIPMGKVAYLGENPPKSLTI